MSKTRIPKCITINLKENKRDRKFMRNVNFLSTENDCGSRSDMFRRLVKHAINHEVKL